MAIKFKFDIFKEIERVRTAIEGVTKELQIIDEMDKEGLDNLDALRARYTIVVQGLGNLSEVEYVARHLENKDPSEVDVYIDGPTLHAINEWGKADDQTLIDLYHEHFGIDVSSYLVEQPDFESEGTSRVLN